MSRFQFGMSFAKAETDAQGKRHVTAKVSDTRVDFHKEHMTERAIESMLSFLKNGYMGADGEHTRVWLLPEHGSSFPIGEATDGFVQKSGDDTELYATFALYEDDPLAGRLYKSVEAGACKQQLSVGGEAIGRPYYSEVKKSVLTALEDVTQLEHVAVTRPNRAAVKSTGFLSAMIKSVEGAGPEKMAFEKAALTDKERAKHASVVWDNARTHDFYVAGDKVHLLPVPPGDKMAAKNALNNLYTYPFTRAERQQIHDKAAPILGDEHQRDSPYCGFCQSDGHGFLDSKDSTQDSKGDLYAMDAQKEAQIDQFVTDTQETLKGIQASLAAITKSVEGQPAAVETPAVETPLAVVKSSDPKSVEGVTAESLKSALDAQAEKFGEIIKGALGAVRPRTGTEVPAGAAAVEKTYEQGAAPAGTSPAAAWLEKNKPALTALLAQRDEQLALVKSGVKLTQDQRNANAVLNDKLNTLGAQVRYAEATGRVPA